MIYSYEGRDINTFDVSESYLQYIMNNDKTVIMKLQGGFVYYGWHESRSQK